MKLTGKMTNYLNTNMTNPFDVAKHPDNLVNISTGVHAMADIQKLMVGLVTKGENMM